MGHPTHHLLSTPLTTIIWPSGARFDDRLRIQGGENPEDCDRYDTKEHFALLMSYTHSLRDLKFCRGLFDSALVCRGFILGFHETHNRKETSEVKFKCCSYVAHNEWERCPSNGPSVEQSTKPPGQVRRTLSPLQITVALSVSGSPFSPPCTEDENLCGFFCLDDGVQLENEVALCSPVVLDRTQTVCFPRPPFLRQR